jgi:hypothetical protein
MIRETPVPEVTAEPVGPRAPDRLAHLAQHRGLIIRRSLLVGAVRGLFPLPVADEQIANRVLAGLLGKLAAGRQVDLPPAAGNALATGPGTVAGLTLAATAVIIARFVGRKFLAVLAAGRGADEMARIFYLATLFDHYCAKLHVGGPITIEDAKRVRRIIEAELAELTVGPALTAFGEGGRILGRTLLEAPRWISQRIRALTERFVRSGGNPDILDAVTEPALGEDTWLERAARAVEDALGRAGTDHLARMIDGFERKWRDEAGPGGGDSQAD